MLATDSFLPIEEREMMEKYLANGYLALPVENLGMLDDVRRLIAQIAAEYLNIKLDVSDEDLLNHIAEHVGPAQLNGLRLAVIERMNAEGDLRPVYYNLAKAALAMIVGNELAMQRRINLSIQMPADESSLLPVHADVWSGDSPFEVVVWLPLVKCHDTKSMFLLPPGPAARLQERFREFNGKSSEDVFHAIESDLIWLDVPYGHIVLFNQNLPHGNRVNREAGTRWTMNCRFKSLFSPYADKKLGEFFEPITMRAATRVGMEYQFPTGFDDRA